MRLVRGPGAHGAHHFAAVLAEGIHGLAVGLAERMYPGPTRSGSLHRPAHEQLQQEQRDRSQSVMKDYTCIIYNTHNIYRLV